MPYIMRVRGKDGSVLTERRHEDGSVETLGHVRSVETSNKQGGYWQRSAANGVMPHKGAIKRAMAMDKKVGAPAIDYDKKGRACFTDAAQKRAWLKAHKRVDLDAGFRDPCPGDYRNQYPPEFDEPSGPTDEQVTEQVRDNVYRAWSMCGGNPFRR